MVSVIRDARIEPERLLLAVTVRHQHRRAQTTARSAPAAGEPASASAPAGPATEPVWTQAQPDSGGRGPEADLHALEQALRERIDAERKDILERARTEGFAAGRQRGEAGFAEQIDALGAVIASAHTALQAGIAGTEDVMVEIAFEAVCKIVGDAMQRSDGVVAVVREILRGVRERERLLVRVAPADHEVLERHRAQLLQGENGQTIDLVADERVVLGGCLVETTGGTLDGRLETQLRRLVDTLSSARRMQGEGRP